MIYLFSYATHSAIILSTIPQFITYQQGAYFGTRARMRGEKSWNFGKQPCVLPTGREKKREKNIFKKFISNVYTTYCEGEKSLRGNNVRSWEASLFHLILNEVLHKLQSLASDFPGESYTLMFTPRKIATRQTQINVYTKGKVENEVSKGHIQVYIYIYSPHPRPSGT